MHSLLSSYPLDAGGTWIFLFGHEWRRAFIVHG